MSIDKGSADGFVPELTFEYKHFLRDKRLYLGS